MNSILAFRDDFAPYNLNPNHNPSLTRKDGNAEVGSYTQIQIFNNVSIVITSEICS